MGASLAMDSPQRRARLARRQHLARATRAPTALEVARNIVALHATDPATVYLSLAARLHQPEVAAIERALYDDRHLLRMLGMRRTMFVVPADFAAVVHYACTRAIAAQERRRTIQLFGQAGLADDLPSWLARLEDETVAALEERGEATAQELGNDVPDLRKQVRLAAGKNYEALQGIVTRVLMQLSADGRIVRGRPKGSWISSQYRWVPIDTWLPGGLDEWTPEAAQVELISRWLRAFGPGSLADIKWWTGLTMGEVKRALAALQVVQVELPNSRAAVVLADDTEPESPLEPWVALLPALDATPMAYTDRAWFMGPHTPALFDRSGNIGPTIWSDGRVVGGWAQRKDGVIVHKLLEDIGSQGANAVELAAHELTRWLGQIRVTPRFRTPLERELSA